MNIWQSFLIESCQFAPRIVILKVANAFCRTHKMSQTLFETKDISIRTMSVKFGSQRLCRIQIKFCRIQIMQLWYSLFTSHNGTFTVLGLWYNTWNPNKIISMYTNLIFKFTCFFCCILCDKISHNEHENYQ